MTSLFEWLYTIFMRYIIEITVWFCENANKIIINEMNMHSSHVIFYWIYLLMQKINQNMRKHELNVCKFNFVDIKPQMVWKQNKQTTW